MVINKSSWHYQWIQYLEASLSNYHYDPKTLCQYFWRFVGLNVEALFVCTVGVAGIFIIPVLLWSCFHNHSVSAAFVLKFMAGFFGSILTGFLIYGLINKLYQVKRTKPTSFTAVVLGTLSAYKKKVCPFIEYRE